MIEHAAAAEGVASPGEPGSLLLGRYRLIERLGKGGFGVVWRAYDEQLQREVAVKRIWLGPDGDVERAAREAQATARLSHPAIVALYEAYASGDAFYLISELVRGPTLARLIAAGALSDEQALAIGAALADALAHAHERGVVHRDIKPSNVLVPADAAEGRAAAKLTDFGGASLLDEEALTRTGDVLGTLAYMAPEQSEGHEVTESADLYSLALVLYEALSDHNPVRGATPAATARRIGSRLEPLRRRRTDLDPRLCAALDAALAPRPDERGTLGDLRAALADAQVGRREEDADRRGRGLRRAPETWAGADHPAHRTQETLERRARAPVSTEPAAGHDLELPAPEHRRGAPRVALLALAVLLAGWQAASGRPGVALLALAALAALAPYPTVAGTRRVVGSWPAAALAPALGLLGLAGAYPALAGQASRWRDRMALGALGYWWLTLAEPLLARRLWLGPPASTPARSAWEGSLAVAGGHVLSPVLTLGVLLGAALWGLGALTLPWLVRGTSATRDALGATVWSAALVAFAPALDGGLSATVHPSPRGAAIGAVLGALAALGARALRGPVRAQGA